MPGRKLCVFLLVIAVSASMGGVLAGQLDVESPDVFLERIPFTLSVKAPDEHRAIDVVVRQADGRVLATGTIPPHGAAQMRVTVDGEDQLPLAIEAGPSRATLKKALLPGWVTVLPPLVAIVLALVVREVFTSLFAGIWLGCLFLAGYNPLTAILMTVGRFGRGALADEDHAAIVIFSLLLGGMVGVLTRMGAARAIVDGLAPLAVTRRRGQLATWLAGLAIFFDDYANTLVVGNTMRPLMDKLKVSREKLAYIVDSTAAPVAAIVFVSTWVGFEISLIEDGLRIAGAQTGTHAAVTPFAIFIASIPYLFYPILAILMVLILIILKRDFGPMLAAERRAARGEGVHRPGAQMTADPNDLRDAPEGVTSHWVHAALPVLAVIITVVIGLYSTGLHSLPAGSAAGLSEVFGHADPFTPLLWGSLIGCIVAVGLAVGGRKLTLSDAIRSWIGGVRSMLLACVILLLAWSLGALTSALGTGTFLSSILSERLPVEALPMIVFVVAALISFATGTSWTTMAILFPMVVPLAVAMGGAADPAQPVAYHHLLGAVAAVMAGSLFGDHCSPISDTTVMSSMASGCDHVDHVRTQLPYAILVAAIAALTGALPSGMGISPWLSLAAGLLLLFGAIRFYGRPVEP